MKRLVNIPSYVGIIPTIIFFEKNYVFIIKTINVFKDKLRVTALGKHKLRPYSKLIQC